MRIVHVTQFFMPWLGYLSYYLPREQLRAGHEVTVLASNLRWPGDASYGVLAQEGLSREMPTGMGQEHGVPCVRLPAARLQLKSTLALKGLEVWLRRLQPDVVIVYLYATPTTLQVARLKRRLGFKLILIESQLPHQARRGWKHRLLRRGVRALGRRLIQPQVDRFVGAAEGSIDWMVRAFDVPREAVTLISLGVDPEVFRPDAAARAETRAALGLSDADFLIGYSGKITPPKRLEVLIDAMQIYLESREGRLVLVGKGDEAYLAELRARAEAAGVPVIWTGMVRSQELPAYFNAMDVCVWPADCSISHIEAASCGTPILIPAGTGVDERVAGGNGILVEGGAEAFAEALVEVSDPARNARMRAAAVAWTQARYHWSAIERAWSEVISACVAQ